MGKNSKELTEQKFRNPIYLKIFYTIGDREICGYQLAKEFNKTRNTLIQQIYECEKEGYISRRSEGRKELFKVNWFKVYKDYKNWVKNRLNNFIDCEM